jgi:HAD superfamily hydrolase (TIGR01509 family)
VKDIAGQNVTLSIRRKGWCITLKRAGKSAQSPISVVAFDLNGTLVNWREAFDESFKAALQEWVGRWNDEEEGDAASRALRVYHDQAAAWNKAGKSRSESLHKERLRWMGEALKDLPLPRSQASASAMLGRIRRLQAENAKLNDGALEAIEKLSGRYKLAIVSDTKRDTAHQVWERTGLKNYINEDCLFTPVSPRKRKNGGELFRLAAKSLGVAPERCIMVGDSWKRDVFAASQAGWRAIWLKAHTKKQASRRLADGTPIVRIGSLSELPRLLI